MAGNGAAPPDGSNGVTRVLIADHHPVTVRGLATVIGGYGGQWEVCGTAADVAEALGKAKELRPDIVIMEHAMPRMNGVQAARELKSLLLQVEVLIYSGTRNRRELLEIFRSSARGCLLKTESLEELRPALDLLRRHHGFRSQGISDLYEEISATEAEWEELTVRESETVRLMAQSRTSKEIARDLGISVKTVESHRNRLFKKLKAESAADVIRYAFESGLAEL